MKPADYFSRDKYDRYYSWIHLPVILSASAQSGISNSSSRHTPSPVFYNSISSHFYCARVLGYPSRIKPFPQSFLLMRLIISSSILPSGTNLPAFICFHTAWSPSNQSCRIMSPVQITGKLSFFQSAHHVVPLPLPGGPNKTIILSRVPAPAFLSWSFSKPYALCRPMGCCWYWRCGLCDGAIVQAGLVGLVSECWLLYFPLVFASLILSFADFVTSL